MGAERKVIHPQAHDNYPVILKGDGEFENPCPPWRPPSLITESFRMKRSTTAIARSFSATLIACAGSPAAATTGPADIVDCRSRDVATRVDKLRSFICGGG